MKFNLTFIAQYMIQRFKVFVLSKKPRNSKRGPFNSTKKIVLDESSFLREVEQFCLYEWAEFAVQHGVGVTHFDFGPVVFDHLVRV